MKKEKEDGDQNVVTKASLAHVATIDSLTHCYRAVLILILHKI